jgi:hypothetical protein
MDSIEEAFSKDTETLQMYEQFKEIKNIYENSLTAMGWKVQTSIISGNTNTSISSLEIGSTKGY